MTNRKFLKDEQALETVEWAIVIGVVSLFTISVVLSLGGWVDTQYGDLKAKTQPAPMVTLESQFNAPDLGYGEVVPWMESQKGF